MAAAAPFAAAQGATVEQWGVFEGSFAGPGSGNPFVDVQFAAVFGMGGTERRVDGFYDGDGNYRVRFMPDLEGEWRFETSSNIPALQGKTGVFRCVAASAGNRGPVGVSNKFHFAYSDGSRYLPIGTTCYAWNHQGEQLERETLNTLRTAPFNKMRMCVFPKSYAWNANEPQYYPFERSAAGVHDFTRFHPPFFRHLEQLVLELQRLGIEADLILFHPYDRWGYADMSRDTDERYLRYITARLAAYRNVWWSMANEYNFMKKKTVADFDRFSQVVKAADPYGHLLSIHNGGSEADPVYDHTRPWISHVSLQSRHLDTGMAMRERFGKPVIFDECYYEGDIPRRWGNISGEEMTRRFWLGTVNGCYVGHGETYLDPKDVLWWSKGGVLKGESPKRIAFLRRILEESPGAGLTPYKSYFPGAGVAGQYLLYYLDIHRPREYTLDLPKDGRWEVDVIDPWQMTIARAGTFSGKAELKMPGVPYMALRARRVS
jgi:hypothetical protein